MGEERNEGLRLDFDQRIRVQFVGSKEGARYNGHFECVCFHNLFCFNQYGDCEGAMLREGNVSSADSWKELLLRNQRTTGIPKYHMGNPGFVSLPKESIQNRKYCKKPRVLTEP